MRDGLWGVGVGSLYLAGSGGVPWCAGGLEQPFPRLELAHAPGWCPARLPQLESSPLEQATLQRRPIQRPAQLCKTRLSLAFRLREECGLETYTQSQPHSFPAALTSHSQVRLRSLQIQVERRKKEE